MHRILLLTLLGSVVGACAASTSHVNPFFEPSRLPLLAPPFDAITDADYRPALEEGMKQQLAEIARIVADPAAPTLANTLVPLEESGQLLTRVSHCVRRDHGREHQRHAEATPRATTPTSGPRCSPTTPTAGSRSTAA